MPQFPDRKTARAGRRLALVPLVAAAIVVAAPVAPASAPNAQGVYSSGGQANGAPTATVSDASPRMGVHETGRKTG